MRQMLTYQYLQKKVSVMDYMNHVSFLCLFDIHLSCMILPISFLFSQFIDYKYKSMSIGVSVFVVHQDQQTGDFLQGKYLLCVSLLYLRRSTADVEARRLGCSTGTVCLLSLPGSAAYGKAPVGRRRTESQEDRSGAGRRLGGWGCGGRHRSTSRTSSSHILLYSLYIFLSEGHVKLKCLVLLSGCLYSKTATTHSKLHEKQNHTFLIHLDT